VPARVSPTEGIRAEIDELFAAGRDLGEVLEDVARLGALWVPESRSWGAELRVRQVTHRAT
jgi:hypothetical protein